MPIQSYRDLQAWQVGMDLAVRVYEVSKRFPKSEVYGLTGQVRRSAVAIPSNVSEGHRHGAKAFSHYLTTALGSLAETETHIDLARGLLFISDQEAESLGALSAQLGRILYGLRRSLNANR